MRKPKPVSPRDLDPDQKACFDLLSRALGGDHHVPAVFPCGSDGIRCRHYGQLATYDFDLLTRLTVLAHDECIRVSIEPASSREVWLSLFKRASREGSFSARHPMLEEAVARIRGLCHKVEGTEAK